MQIDWIVEFSHGQFDLMDAGDVSHSSLTDEQLARRALVNEDLTGITVSSPRHGRFLRLQIDVTDRRPSMDFGEWDHVDELCFSTLSGELNIWTTCGDMVYDTASYAHLRGVFSVDPGIYQLYVLSANLASMEMRLCEASKSEAYSDLFYGRHDDGVPDLETLMTFDHYRIIMWCLGDKVLKCFSEGS